MSNKAYFAFGIMLFTIIFKFSYCAAQSNTIPISGNFKQCLLTEPLHHISLDTLCDDDGISDQHESCHTCKNEKNSTQFITKNAMIFTKRHFIVDGYGYKCTMIEKIWTLSKDIFNQPNEKETTRFITLTRYDCLKMIEADMCGRSKMNCKGKDECYFTETIPSKNYPGWWSSYNVSQFICSYQKTTVLGKTNTTKLFKDGLGTCRANDLECYLENSIIIWNNDIVRDCLFESVLFIDDLLRPYLDQSSLYVSDKNHFLFKLTSEYETACGGIQFYKTLEGLYFVPLMDFTNKNKVLNLPKATHSIGHLQDNDIREFMLSEVDYDKRNMLATVARAACSSLINTIRSNMNSNDKFLIINEFGIQDIIIYINDGLPYLPFCSNVSLIHVLQSTSNCYRDFAIQYQIGNTIKNGFLRPSGILSEFSEIIDCKSSNKTLILDKSKKIIKRKNTSITVLDFDASHTTRLKIPFLHAGTLNDIFKHNEMIVNSSSTLELVEEMIASQENEKIFYVKNNDEYGKILPKSAKRGPSQLIGSLVDSLKEISNQVWDILIYIFTALVSLGVLALLLYCAITCCIKNRSRLCRGQTRNKNTHEHVELMSLP